MNATRAGIVAAALVGLTLAVGCDKSIDVEAVSVSDANGKTVALEGDSTAVHLHEHELEMPVEVAFRATGDEVTTGRSLDLAEFELRACEMAPCTVAKLGSCSGEVCTAIVRWSEPGFCAFETRIVDNAGDGVGSTTYLYVGLDGTTERKALEALSRTPVEETRAQCQGE